MPTPVFTTSQEFGMKEPLWQPEILVLGDLLSPKQYLVGLISWIFTSLDGIITFISISTLTFSTLYHLGGK
jgi:hypothetical protein